MSAPVPYQPPGLPTAPNRPYPPRPPDARTTPHVLHFLLWIVFGLFTLLFLGLFAFLVAPLYGFVWLFHVIVNDVIRRREARDYKVAWAAYAVAWERYKQEHMVWQLRWKAITGEWPPQVPE